MDNSWGPLGRLTAEQRSALQEMPALAFGEAVRFGYDAKWGLKRDHPEVAAEIRVIKKSRGAKAAKKAARRFAERRQFTTEMLVASRARSTDAADRIRAGTKIIGVELP